VGGAVAHHPVDCELSLIVSFCFCVTFRLEFDDRRCVAPIETEMLHGIFKLAFTSVFSVETYPRTRGYPESHSGPSALQLKYAPPADKRQAKELRGRFDYRVRPLSAGRNMSVPPSSHPYSFTPLIASPPFVPPVAPRSTQNGLPPPIKPCPARLERFSCRSYRHAVCEFAG